MKIHVVTVGAPKLPYAKAGWDEYRKRLQHYHDIRVTHVPDKHNDARHLLEAAGTALIVACDDEGQQYSSPKLAAFLEKLALQGREVCFLIGGPEGLPEEVLAHAHYKWSFGQLTFPHDLAMVVLLEALYRASTISAGQPYHK